MENQNKEIQKVIPLVRKSDTFKLVIPEEVENKIRFICQQIWKDEWSGTLFYKPEGSFEDGTLTIRCVDIYVMDIGTAAYTEFDMSPDVISYMTENMELLDCQMGLIHSHNNMSTFFSGTDTSTLKEEGIDRNHFVSLIVNNAGSYTAAITRRVKSTKTIKDNFSYPTFEDKVINSDKLQTVEEEELEWYYLNIEFERSGTFYIPFKERLDEIKKLKEEKARQSKAIVSTVPNYGKPVVSTTKLGKQTPIQSYISPVGHAGTIKTEVIEEQSQLPFDWDYMDGKIDSDISYDNIHFNKKIIKSLVLQLITGSIILPNESKVDAKKWAKGMVPIFKKRFGHGEPGLKLFKVWAEGYIEYLCWFTDDDDLINKGVDDDAMAYVCAHDMIEELTKLPTNEYIKIYIDILKGYSI